MRAITASSAAGISGRQTRTEVELVIIDAEIQGDIALRSERCLAAERTEQSAAQTIDVRTDVYRTGILYLLGCEVFAVPITAPGSVNRWRKWRTRPKSSSLALSSARN